MTSIVEKRFHLNLYSIRQVIVLFTTLIRQTGLNMNKRVFRISEVRFFAAILSRWSMYCTLLSLNWIDLGYGGF